MLLSSDQMLEVSNTAKLALAALKKKLIAFQENDIYSATFMIDPFYNKMLTEISNSLLGQKSGLFIFKYNKLINKFKDY